MGCNCTDEWEFRGQVFDECANPNKDPLGSWCIVDPDSCPTIDSLSNFVNNNYGMPQGSDYCLLNYTGSGSPTFYAKNQDFEFGSSPTPYSYQAAIPKQDNTSSSLNTGFQPTFTSKPSLNTSLINFKPPTPSLDTRLFNSQASAPIVVSQDTSYQGTVYVLEATSPTPIPTLNSPAPTPTYEPPRSNSAFGFEPTVSPSLDTRLVNSQASSPTPILTTAVSQDTSYQVSTGVGVGRASSTVLNLPYQQSVQQDELLSGTLKAPIQEEVCLDLQQALMENEQFSIFSNIVTQTGFGESVEGRRNQTIFISPDVAWVKLADNERVDVGDLFLFQSNVLPLKEIIKLHCIDGLLDLENISPGDQLIVSTNLNNQNITLTSDGSKVQVISPYENREPASVVGLVGTKICEGQYFIIDDVLLP